MIENAAPICVILLHVTGVTNPFGLRFRDQDKADATFEAIVQTPVLMAGGKQAAIDIEDDYGQKVSVLRADVKVAQFMDVGRDLEAQGDIAILQARENAKIQSRAQGDSVLALHRDIAPQRGQLIRPS